MRLSSRSYPHPVLGNGDDVSGAGFQATFEYASDQQFYYITVTVECSSATLAKLISDTAKPFGALAVLDPDAERMLLGRTPVTEVCGIGARRAARLAAHGLTTALDLALADRRFIRELLTVVGEAIWHELNGDPVLPLYTKRPPHKVLSRGGNI